MAGRRGNGEGTIYRRNDGTWCGMLTNGRDPSTGKLKRVTYYGKTRSEVADKIYKAQSEIKTGIFIEPTKVKLAEWLDTWMKDYMKPKLRPTTFESYEYIVRIHLKPEIGNMMLRDLRPEHLQKLYNDKFERGKLDGEGGLSSRSVRYIHMVLHNSLDQAIKNQLIGHNVSEATTLPRQTKKDIRVFSIEEQYKFITVLENERLSTAFKLDLATGLRLGELLALKWQDVALENESLSVKRSLKRVKLFEGEKNSEIIFQEPKTKSGKRNIPLIPTIIEELKEHRKRQDDEKAFAGTSYEDNGLVFCTELGKPIEPRNMIRKFYKLVEDANLALTNFHALRHTFATRALESGMNPKVLQEILGHSSITMTMDIYSHAMPDFKKSSIMKMDYLFSKQQKNCTEEKDKEALQKSKRQKTKTKSRDREMSL